jgi:putative membrane protein
MRVPDPVRTMDAMTTPLLIPLDGGRFGPRWAGGDPSTTWGGGPPFAHLLGVGMFCLFLLLVAASLFFLFRTGRVGPPPWAQHRGPEAEAKRVLAERFARGDITTDEFMEKASVLNWTPGTDPYENWRPRKKPR